MRALSASELLYVWEQGLAQKPVKRALMLLTAACPETQVEALANLRIGERDARLLTLREWLLVRNWLAWRTARICRERVELTFNTADLRVMPDGELGEAFGVDVDRYHVNFRRPTARIWLL